MAYDIVSQELVDPHGGRKGLESSLIKATSDAFGEDELRVLRVARFVARYNFDIEPQTKEMMQELEKDLPLLPAERVWQEVKKVLGEDKPDLFFRTLKKLGLLEVLFPELQAMVGLTQPTKHHPEGDVFEHTMQSLRASAQLTHDLLIRFGALVHDFGKINSPENNLPHHYGHDKRGIQVVEGFCERLKTSKEFKRTGVAATRFHMKINLWKEMSSGKTVRMLKNIRKTPLGVSGVIDVALADKKGRNTINQSFFDDFAGLIDLTNDLFRQINGQTVDFGDRTGRARGELLFQRRASWLGQNKKDYI